MRGQLAQIGADLALRYVKAGGAKILLKKTTNREPHTRHKTKVDTSQAT